VRLVLTMRQAQWEVDLRFATSVEAGMAVVNVSGRGLANDEGAQHRSR
jgi:hypothetical protein